MSENGMHKKLGERDGRSPNHKISREKKFSSGLRKLRSRARLSNALGYDSNEVPRINRLGK
ncbi:MAG: hypothetical protein CL993_03520 [Euryarchaeota archaeon]|nr:hypothetical protein [Euryarchaeota archaeon]